MGIEELISFEDGVIVCYTLHPRQDLTEYCETMLLKYSKFDQLKQYSLQPPSAIDVSYMSEKILTRPNESLVFIFGRAIHKTGEIEEFLYDIQIDRTI